MITTIQIHSKLINKLNQYELLDTICALPFLMKFYISLFFINKTTFFSSFIGCPSSERIYPQFLRNLTSTEGSIGGSRSTVSYNPVSSMYCVAMAL